MDGVCDDVDLCPHAYDPGQADLDGDGIGFVCDPVESVTFSGRVGANLGGNADTMAASAGAGGSVVYVVAAGPDGQFVGGSYNDQFQNPWLAAAVGGVVGPVVSPDGAIFFSYADERFDTAVLDLKQRAFVSRGHGAIANSGDVRIPSDVVMLRTMGRVAANVASGDQLTEIVAGHDIVLQPSTSGVLGMELSGTGIGSYANGEYKRGVDGLSDVVSLQPYAYFTKQPMYCGFAQGESPALYTLHDTGVVSAALPFVSCAVSSYEAASADRVYVEGDLGAPNNNKALVFVHDDKVTTVYSGEPRDGSVKITGEELQVVTRTFSADNSGKAWIVTPAGMVIAIPETLYGVVASVYGDTVHVAGVRSVTNGFGPPVIYRYREATGLEHVDMTANAAALSAHPTLITTHEGAAILEESGVWRVPSASMTVATLALHDIQGGVRGDATMIAGSGQSGNPAVYAYDEIGGPRLVPLTNEQQGLGASVIDSPFRASPWFRLHDTTDKVARVVYENGTPKLDAFPVAQLFNLRIIGQRANGDFIATDDKEVYVFGAAGVEHVASFPASQFVVEPFIVDYKTTPPTIVGFMGMRADRNVVCLASHPERCWDVPGGDLQQVKVVWATAEGDGDFRIVSSATSLATVRALGTGTAPPPL